MSKKTILAMSVVATFVLFIVYGTSSGCSSGEPGQSDSLKGDSVAVTTINSSYSMLPMDITEMSQNAADSFSWRTFIALNWPADQATCSADTTKLIYPMIRSLFLPETNQHRGVLTAVWKRPYNTCHQKFRRLQNKPASAALST